MLTSSTINISKGVLVDGPAGDCGWGISGGGKPPRPCPFRATVQPSSSLGPYFVFSPERNCQ